MFSTTNNGLHDHGPRYSDEFDTGNPVSRILSAIAVKIWGQLAVIIRTIGICQRKLVGNRERVDLE